MSTILKIVKDGSNTPVYSRRLSDESYGIYAQAYSVYSVAIPEQAQIAVIGSSTAVMTSHTTYSSPVSAGDIIPAGVSVNTGSIWLAGKTHIYFSTIAEGLVNIEFYRVLGGGDY